MHTGPDFFTARRINAAAGVFFGFLLVASVALGQMSPFRGNVAGRGAASLAKTEPVPAAPLAQVALAPAVPVFTPSMLPSSASPVLASRAAATMTTGVVRVPASVAGVLVDGAPRRVASGSLLLTCGWHKIKTPQHPARPVNVPCGGTAML